MTDARASRSPGPAGGRLAQYELLRSVGSGAMGVVHQARDTDLDRLVAIKLLHPVADPEEGRMRHERFLREARAAAQLSHPNVATVHQVGRHGAQTFIVMEWLGGGDLAAHVRAHGPMPWPQALAAAAEAAAGLAAAHAAGLVHRDIKPSNLMRGDGATVKLVDFGLARWQANASELTATGTLLGTPAYLSPELCSGADATPASDVYALGCTLVHLLTGRPPFPGPSIAMVLSGHVNEAPPDLRALVPELPDRAVRLVARALAKRPSERHAHAGALLDDLQRALEGPQDDPPVRSAVGTIVETVADTIAEGRATSVGPHATAATATLALRGHVPAEPGPLIGREPEAAALAHALATSRIVTLTGPGGTGKSRLALHVAHAIASRQAAWFVELAPLAAGHDVAAAVAAILELRESAGETPQDALAKALRDEPTLLVLDNCEHVRDGAAELAVRLAAACPLLQIVATSRQPLDCPGEAVLPIPPLPTGSDGEGAAHLLAAEAVRLFAERARQARPGFIVDAGNVDAVAAICRRLDGLPLAIELAAARVKVLSLAQITSRLADAFRLLTGGSALLEPRQQTLRALVDWSWDLLDDDERHAFERCSVFAGEFGIEDAEAVLAGDGLAPDAVLDLLAQLVDQSLLVAVERDDAVHYRLLETLRQYAAHKRQARGGGDAVVRRHADHYAARALACVARLQHTDRSFALADMARNRDQIHAALQSAMDARWFDVGTTLAAALAEYWTHQGRIAEGLAWIERFLTATPPEDAALAELLRGAGFLALFGGRQELARQWAGRGLDVARRIGHRLLEARCIDLLGSCARAAGQLVVAERLYREALDHSRRHGLRETEASAHNHLAIVHDQQGHGPEARQHAEAALAIHRELGRALDTAIVQMNLATLALNAEDIARAEALFASCVTLFDDFGDAWNGAYARGGMGCCEMSRGDLAAARRHFEAALAVVRTLGDRDYEGHALDYLARIALLDGRTAAAADLSRRALQIRLEASGPGDIATSLETMAWLHAAARPDHGARLLGCARGLRRRGGEPAVLFEQRRLDEIEATLASALGAARLAQQLGVGDGADPATLAGDAER